MSSKNFLDVDESIMEKNLLINKEEQEFEQFVSGFLDPNSGILVTPAPGLCIKTYKADKSKVFINLCYHADIPPPENITKEKLIEVLKSKDPDRFCVPLSIGTEHEEDIKSGGQAKVYDVAVNTEFFKKCEGDELFQSFIVAATLEGIAEKFKIQLTSENPIILKNKKCIGSLQQHRIQQRPPRSSSIKKKPLIQELNTKGSHSQLNRYVQPKFGVFVQPEDNPKRLLVDVWLPEVNGLKEIDLKCGEDTLLLTTNTRTKYKLDICFPYTINEKNANVKFNSVTNILSVEAAITGTN